MLTSLSVEVGAQVVEMLDDDPCLIDYVESVACRQPAIEPPNYHTTHSEFDTSLPSGQSWVFSGSTSARGPSSSSTGGGDARIRVGDDLYHLG